MTHTTERCYEVAGGVLKLSLRTDHPLSSNESEALDRVGEEYLGCFERVRSRRFDDDDDDRARASHRRHPVDLARRTTSRRSTIPSRA